MPTKLRKSISQGLIGGDGSGWQLPGMTFVDFGELLLAGATTIRKTAAVLPLQNTYPKNPDNYPTTLAAASGGRQIGSGATQFAGLTGVWLVHITGAGAVYNPVTTTFQIKVISTVTTVVGALTNLTGAFNASAAVNGIDQITITAPAERQFTIDGSANLTTAAWLFNGDVLFVEMVAAGALTTQANILGIALEWA